MGVISVRINYALKFTILNIVIFLKENKLCIKCYHDSNVRFVWHVRITYNNFR